MYKLRAISKKNGGAVFFMSSDLEAVKGVAKNLSNVIGPVYIECKDRHEKEYSCNN